MPQIDDEVPLQFQPEFRVTGKPRSRKHRSHGRFVSHGYPRRNPFGRTNCFAFLAWRRPARGFRVSRDVVPVCQITWRIRVVLRRASSLLMMQSETGLVRTIWTMYWSVNCLNLRDFKCCAAADRRTTCGPRGHRDRAPTRARTCFEWREGHGLEYTAYARGTWHIFTGVLEQRAYANSQSPACASWHRPCA